MHQYLTLHSDRTNTNNDSNINNCVNNSTTNYNNDRPLARSLTQNLI